MFRGLANWAIFLDHIPNNAIAWLTTRNFGFSDAAELFVFISGYTATIVYARRMKAQGFIATSALMFGRVWQIYAAYVLLFMFYTAAIGYAAYAYARPQLLDDFNVRIVFERPVETIQRALLLQFEPLNLDVLPLYVVLMAAFPPVLWALTKRPGLVLAASCSLYVVSRLSGWNVPEYPSGTWYFNPLAWQLLFVIGGWVAAGGAVGFERVWRSRTGLIVAAIYLVTALLLTLAVRLVPALTQLSSLIPTDKTNLSAFRILHFLALMVVAVNIMPVNWAVLRSSYMRPLVLCGQKSLDVFCVGVFLSFLAHLLIELEPTSLIFKMAVSAGGIAVMTGVAYYKAWTEKLRSVDRTQLVRVQRAPDRVR